MRGSAGGSCGSSLRAVSLGPIAHRCSPDAGDGIVPEDGWQGAAEDLQLDAFTVGLWDCVSSAATGPRESRTWTVVRAAGGR